MTGISASPDRTDRPGGFTLLELLVVCILMALMLSIAVPNVRSLYRTDPLAQSARMIERIVDRARNRALELDGHLLLSIDAATGELSVHMPGTDGRLHSGNREGAAVTLPEGVAIVSIWKHVVEQERGEPVTVWVNRRGMIEPLVINIRDRERAAGLSFSPFVPVRISDSELIPSLPGFARID